jgi:hypothetical protein
MDRMPEPPGADTDGGSMPDSLFPLGAEDRIARNRRAVAAYLRVASVTDARRCGNPSGGAPQS